MWKKVLVVVLAVIAVLAATIASRPASYEVERSATIAAPPAVVYAQVADFGRWAAWSPWAKLDPNMKTTLTGAPASVGHGYAWAGDSKVGEGRMTITEVFPGRLVSIKLEFLKPFASTSPTAFALAPDGDATRITWKMTGTNNFVGKAMGLFMDFEKMIGADFEKGLTQLKVVAEAEARQTPPTPPAQAAADPSK